MSEKDLIGQLMDPDKVPSEEEIESGDFGSLSGAEKEEAEELAEYEAEFGKVSAEEEQQKEEDSPKEEEDPKPVAAKDGEHTIPYSVLEATRARAASAEERLQAVSREMEALRTKLQDSTEGSEKPELDPFGEEPDWDGLKEQYVADGIVDQLKRVHDAWKTTHGELQRARQEAEDARRRAEEEAQEATGREVQAAIDAHKELAEWQAEDGNTWALAREVDSRLLQDPNWAGKPLAERFGEVVRIVTGRRREDGDEIKRKADELMAKANEKGAVPRSMSELPGGEPPASNPFEQLDKLSGAAQLSAIQGMTDDQIDAWLAS